MSITETKSPFLWHTLQKLQHLMSNFQEVMKKQEENALITTFQTVLVPLVILSDLLLDFIYYPLWSRLLAIQSM